MKNNYYQKHRKRLQKKACVRHQNLSEEGKSKREKRDKKDIKTLLKNKNEERCNKNISEEQKEMLVEYQRNYYLIHYK